MSEKTKERNKATDKPKKRKSSSDEAQRLSQYNMAVSLADWLKGVGVESKTAMVYEKLLNDRQYKTIFDLVEAQPSVQDMVRYGVEDDRNLLLFVKALNEATLDFDRKKAKKVSSKSNRKLGSEVITLNVGGHVYQTRRDTLLSLPETYFTKLLTGPLGEASTEFFIDRDGTKFGPILNYMRDIKDHYLLNQIDPVEATFYLLPLPPLLLTLHNARQETRALVNRVHDGLAEEMSALLASRPPNQDYALIPIVSHVEWLNLIHHHSPLERECKQIMFENIHPKLNTFFWAEFREAFREMRLSFDIVYERMDALSAYTLKVQYVGVRKSEFAFGDKGSLLVSELSILQSASQTSPNTNAGSGQLTASNGMMTSPRGTLQSKASTPNLSAK